MHHSSRDLKDENFLPLILHFEIPTRFLKLNKLTFKVILISKYFASHWTVDDALATFNLIKLGADLSYPLLS